MKQTGLLLGKKDLIDAAQLNNSPYSKTIGRGMKVGKEEIIGLVAAVDWFLKQDDAAKWKRSIAAERSESHSSFKAFNSVEGRIFISPVANHVPHLVITYDLNRIKLSPSEVMQKAARRRPAD